MAYKFSKPDFPTIGGEFGQLSYDEYLRVDMKSNPILKFFHRERATFTKVDNSAIDLF